MDETLKKVNDLLKAFNNSFKISANFTEDNDDKIANGLKIDELKNDGSQFIDEMFNMFSDVVSAVSENHELVYNEDMGLVIARKVVSIDYIIEK